MKFVLLLSLNDKGKVIVIIHKGVENKKFIRFNNDNHLYWTADLQAIDCSLLSNRDHIHVSL